MAVIAPTRSSAVPLTSDDSDVVVSEGYLPPGMSIEEAKWQNDFALLVQAYREKYPETFADASISLTAKEQGLILFTETAPPEVLASAERLKGVRISITPGPSEMIASEIAGRLLVAASQYIDDRRFIALSYDPATQTYSIVLGPARDAEPLPAVSPSDLELLHRRLQEVVEIPSGAAVNLTYDVNYQADWQAAPWDGGEYMHGSTQCQGAFPVRKLPDGPEIGVLTAGHCSGGANTAYGLNSSLIFNPTVPYSLYTGLNPNGGEFRWAWSKEMFSGYTKISMNSRAKFTAAAPPVVGKRLCKYGIASGSNCGTVSSTTYYELDVVPPEDGGGQYVVGPLSQTETCITSPGDSGSGWFALTTGFGITAGCFGGHSTMSSLPNALNKLGLYLWQG